MRNNGKYLKITVALMSFLVYIVFDALIKDFSGIDVTGLGQIFLYILIGIFVILGMICLRYAFLVSEKGVNYEFNRMMGIIFIIFSILCCSMGIFLRASEEKMAKESYERFEMEISEDVVAYLKNKLDDDAELTTVERRQEARLEDIRYEINKNPNIIQRYILVFFERRIFRDWSW